MQPVLFKRHFQIAYLVDDVEQAMSSLGRNHGITKWDLMDMKAAGAPHSPLQFIANAWAGEMMIELLQADEAVESLYSGWQRDKNLPLRLHHFGFLVDSAEQFSSHCRQLADNGSPIVVEGSFGDVLDYAYADTTAELGHYYEIIRLKSEGEAFFGRVPVN